MAQAQRAAQGAKSASAIGTVVVGQERLHRHAAVGEPAVGEDQECRGTDRRLIGEEPRIGQARAIVDGDVEELHATAAAAPTVIAVDAVPHPTEATELLSVQVDQLARHRSLIAADRRGHWARATRQAKPTLDVDDGRERQVKVSRDPE